MIKSNYFPNIEFKTQDELFLKLKEYEKDIIDFKCSQIYKSADKGQAIKFVTIDAKENTEKALFKAKDNFVYPIISSTNYMDSHDDVHLEGCFTKTAKERQGKVFFVDTHGKKMSDIITRKSDIRMFVNDVDWKILGKEFDGKSQSLLFEISRDKVRPDALELIDNEPDLECSIEMRYIKMYLAVNSQDKYFAENKAFFDANIDKIANKELALEKNYFFGVTELAIVNEGSLCPIVGGSNGATRVYQNKQAEQSLENKEEPLQNTQTEKRKLSII